MVIVETVESVIKLPETTLFVHGSNFLYITTTKATMFPIYMFSRV